jgi:hypothetical protein
MVIYSWKVLENILNLGVGTLDSLMVINLSFLLEFSIS